MGTFRKVPGQRLRRGLLGLQQFLDPSAAHVIEAIDEVRHDDADGDAGGTVPEEDLRAELTEAFGHAPIDVEGVQGLLTIARDKGLDAERLFEEAIARELAERPFRGPQLPTWSRVAPPERG